MKDEAVYTPPNYLRSLKLKVRAKTTLTDNKAFAASMRAKVTLTRSFLAANAGRIRFKYQNRCILWHKEQLTSSLSTVEVSVINCNFRNSLSNSNSAPHS